MGLDSIKVIEIDTNLCIRICEKVVLTLIGLDEKVAYVPT